MDTRVLIIGSSFDVDSDFMYNENYLEIFRDMRENFDIIGTIYFDFMNRFIYEQKPTIELLRTLKELNVIYDSSLNMYSYELIKILRFHELRMRYDIILLLGCGPANSCFSPEAIMAYNYLTTENGIIYIRGKPTISYHKNIYFDTISSIYRFYMDLYSKGQLDTFTPMSELRIYFELFAVYFVPIKRKDGIEIYKKNNDYAKDSILLKSKHAIMHSLTELNPIHEMKKYMIVKE